jgi:hypothetical protein
MPQAVGSKRKRSEDMNGADDLTGLATKLGTLHYKTTQHTID